MNKIKTKLKFVKSERSGAWVGFASQNPKNGRIFGVREDDERLKKVCVASYECSSVIEAGVLYDVEMVPMKNANAGYVVLSAVPHAFEAKIEATIVKNAIYKVEVKFGNKTILYDPKEGKHDTVKNLEECAKVLKARKDIKDLMQVLDDFNHAAQIVLANYENDKNSTARKNMFK